MHIMASGNPDTKAAAEQYFTENLGVTESIVEVGSLEELVVTEGLRDAYVTKVKELKQRGLIQASVTRVMGTLASKSAIQFLDTSWNINDDGARVWYGITNTFRLGNHAIGLDVHSLSEDRPETLEDMMRSAQSLGISVADIEWNVEHEDGTVVKCVDETFTVAKLPLVRGNVVFDKGFDALSPGGLITPPTLNAIAAWVESDHSLPFGY